MSDLVLALIVAAATATGASVGGLLTGRVTLRAEDKRQTFRREERTLERAAEEEENRTRFRAAARLVHLDLHMTRVLLESMVESGQWPSPPPSLPHLGARGQEIQLLASGLRPEAWHTLLVAQSAFFMAESTGLWGALRQGGRVDDEVLGNVLQTVKRISVAEGILEIYALPPARDQVQR